jgi:hypothetical protein
MKYCVWARTLAILTAVCIALSPSAAWAASIGKIADITKTNAVYFGRYQQTSLGTVTPSTGASGADWVAATGANDDNGFTAGTTYYFNIEPVEWRVLENSGGELFLLSEQNLDVKPYDKDNANKAVTWETSTIRSWLNGYTANQGGAPALNLYTESFIGTAFDSKENAAIAVTAVNNPDNPTYGTSGGNPTTDKIFLLSIQEVRNTPYGFDGDLAAPDSARIARNTAYTANKPYTHASGVADVWWLRSPGIIGIFAANVLDGVLDYSGANPGGGSVDGLAGAVRPALKLNLSSVIFTSAAAGGKSPSLISSNLEPASTPSAGEAVKLTLQTSAQTLEVAAAAAQRTQSGNTLSFTYQNATAGARQFVSCALEQGGAVKYYGKLADSSGSSSGTLAIPLTGVADGTYMLKIFSEQDNGDNRTDFASAPVSMTVAVAGNIGTVK